MSKLIEVELIDNQVLVFTDGEVLRTIHKGFNRIGKEWEFSHLEHEDSSTKYIASEPTHIYNDKFECLVFKDTDKFRFWQDTMLRRLSRDVLNDLGDHDTANIVQSTIKG